MTYEAFLNALAACQGQYTWYRAGSAAIRGQRGPIRAVGRVYCPLTAVAASRGLGDLPPLYWVTAAEGLGIPQPLAATITDAADGVDGPIRQDLLRVLGLAPAVPS